MIKVNNLGVSGLAADFWGTPGPATDEGQEDDLGELGYIAMKAARCWVNALQRFIKVDVSGQLAFL